MENSTGTKKKKDLEDFFLNDLVVSGKNIVIVFSDHEIVNDRLKWYTKEYLGTHGGKLISRRFIKYIQPES